MVISFRKAGLHSVWAPACQDSIPGGHAGVGVVSLGGAPLALPSIVTPEFREFFRLGRVLRTTLPTGKGGVVHLFLFMGIRVRRRMLISYVLLIGFFKLFLLRLRWFVLVSLCLLLVILMLILQSYPVWLRVCLLVGMLIWLLRILWCWCYA